MVTYNYSLFVMQHIFENWLYKVILSLFLDDFNGTFFVGFYSIGIFSTEVID